MFIKEAYQYLFYKFYKSIKNISIPEFWSDWKAIAFIIMLEIMLYFSLVIYYEIYVNRYSNFLDNNLITGLYLASIIALNYFAFSHKEKWKDVVNRFDKWPRKKNIIGGWLVLGVVVIIVGNLILAFYAMSQINWKQYS